MSDWFTHCLECAERQHNYARYLLRSAARDPFPPGWHVEHRNLVEARSVLRDAIKWVWAAKDERERMEHAYDMRKLRSRSPGQPEVEPNEMAVHEA